MGVLKPALPLLFSSQTPTLKNLLKHTHSLSHAHSSTNPHPIVSSPNFSLCIPFLIFLHHPSRMVHAKPVLLAVLSLFVLCLLSTTIELVQCSLENKILSLKEFQWKHNDGAPSCLSHKSSECYLIKWPCLFLALFYSQRWDLLFSNHCFFILLRNKNCFNALKGKELVWSL